MCILTEKVRAGTYDREVSASQKITTHQRRVLNFDSQSSDLFCKRSDHEKSDFQTARVLVHVCPSVVGCAVLACAQHSVRFRSYPACDSVTFAVSCLCLSPSESLYFCTRFFSSGFLVSYPVLIRFVSFTIWCLLMNVSRLVFLSTSTARLYLLLELARFCDLLSYRCVFVSLLSRPSFTHS